MKRKTKEKVISEFIDIHGNMYDYSKVVYINNSTKIIITCNLCGREISITPSHHLRGQGCKPCGIKRFADSQRKSTDDFKIEANKSHHGKYDYSKSVYVSRHKKLTIICPVHGEFEQTPGNHYRYGCNKCGCEITAKKQKHSNIEVLNQMGLIHSNKYLYPGFDNSSMKGKIDIECPIHGIFKQKLSNHIHKQYGCPKCASHISKQEIELQEWLSQYVNIETNNRHIIPPLEIDIVIPSHKIAIEYNGIYWHGEQWGKDKHYHINKYKKCQDVGYRLIQIWENEWLQKKDIVKSIILSSIGIYDRKVNGRECVITNVDVETAKTFYNDNHIQGFQSGNHHALYHQDELVSMMTVKYFEKAPMLERFVNKKCVMIHGAFSKLLKSFDNIEGMETFSDPRWFSGNVYQKNGFTLVDHIKPNYWYFKINTIDLIHRRRFQLGSIEKNGLSFDPNLTEYQNMLTNKYDRIWDCGNLKYIYTGQ